MAARSWVTVSWVATASYSGVESSTRARLPMAPAWLGGGFGVLEQAPGTARSPQAVALAGEHRRVEGLGPGAQAGGGLPTQVHLQAVTGLAVREPLEGLQDHGRGQHPGRHGRAPPGRGAVQVGEVVVGEDAGTFVGQQAVDRALPQTVAQQLAGDSKRSWGCARPSAIGVILTAPVLAVVDPLSARAGMLSKKHEPPPASRYRLARFARSLVPDSHAADTAQQGRLNLHAPSRRDEPDVRLPPRELLKHPKVGSPIEGRGVRWGLRLRDDRLPGDAPHAVTADPP